MEESLQEKYAPGNACFGCGPSNPKGLHVRSLVRGTEVIAEWKAEKHHEAFPGVLNGGIIGSLLDCHSNWTAAWAIMSRTKADRPPCTVTSQYSIKLLRPTPSDQPIQLVAVAKVVNDDRAVIDAKLICGGKVCALCEGTFVAVEPGHPAYHRW